MPNKKGHAKWSGTLCQMKDSNIYVLQEKVNEKWYVLKDSNAPFPCRT